MGVQPEKIYVEIERSKLSELGISPNVIANTLAQANQMTPAGMIETTSDNVNVRVTGIFDDVDSIKNLPINANGKIFRLVQASIKSGITPNDATKNAFNDISDLRSSLPMVFNRSRWII